MSSKKPITRRQAIQGLGAGAAWGLAGCPGPTTGPKPPGEPERPPPPDSPWAGKADPSAEAFPQGVRSGDPTPGGALAWTWAFPGSALVLHAAFWDGEEWQDVEETLIDAGDSGHTHHELTGFPADTVVAFQFTNAEGVGSEIGQCRTALVAGGAIRFGVISCTKTQWSPFPCLGALAEEALDFCIYLGDTSYNDGAETLEEYRDAWSHTLGEAEYRALLQSCSMIATWDDHEVLNNWDRETISEERMNAATSAFFEALPIRQREGSEFGLWRALRWGDTAEVFVLDCRGERYPSRSEYISPAQLDWLIEGVCRSTAKWKVIVNSVPITNMPPVFDVEIAIRDRWEGFVEQRSQLIQAVTDCGATGVLFLGGDLHMSAFAKVEPEGAGSQLLELIVGPTGQRPNVLGALIETSEQFPYSGSQVCAAIIELSGLGTGAVSLIGETGEALAQADFGHLGQYANVWSRDDDGSQ